MGWGIFIAYAKIKRNFETFSQKQNPSGPSIVLHLVAAEKYLFAFILCQTPKKIL